MNFLVLKPLLSLGIAGVISLAAIGALVKINMNDLAHVESAVDRQTENYTEIQQATNNVLLEMTKAIEKQSGALDKNTQVLNQLLIKR